MRISDSVANYILQMLNDENGIAEIQRNELANTAYRAKSTTSSRPVSHRSRDIS